MQRTEYIFCKQKRGIGYASELRNFQTVAVTVYTRPQAVRVSEEVVLGHHHIIEMQSVGKRKLTYFSFVNISAEKGNIAKYTMTMVM